MNEQYFFSIILVIWIILSGFIFFILFFITAPYGRHIKKGWGLNINSSLAWIFMESVSLLMMIFLFLIGDRRFNVVAIMFLSMWVVHYSHRSFIYPFRRQADKKMPLLIMLMAIFFNCMNAYINGRYLFKFSLPYNLQWLMDIRFIIGFCLFGVGFIINVYSDHMLIKLRKENKNSYKIPFGGLYRWVSCPNYLGEILEWTGWAIATWSLAGLSFALWTIANLVPRARANHLWYKKTFSDYPPDRKALIPFIY